MNMMTIDFVLLCHEMNTNFVLLEKNQNAFTLSMHRISNNDYVLN